MCMTLDASMRELEDTSACSIGDLLRLKTKIVEKFESIVGVPKMKLHNLIELLCKSKDADPFTLNALNASANLEEVQQQQATHMEQQTIEDNLLNCTAKLALTKFNCKIRDQPAQKKKVANSLRKIRLEDQLCKVNADNERWKKINKAFYSYLREAATTRTTQKVTNSKRKRP